MKNTTEKKKQLQKVKIVWRDAVSHAEWLNPEDVKKYKPYLNVSEGFLLEKNKNATIVYMSYNDTDIGDVCVIPSENVVSLCELKTSKKYVSKSPKTLKG